MSILIPPGTTTQLQQPIFDRAKLLSDVSNIVAKHVVEFPSNIIVHNWTKGCNVEMKVESGRLQITVTNPADQKFDLLGPDASELGKTFSVEPKTNNKHWYWIPFTDNEYQVRCANCDKIIRTMPYWLEEDSEVSGSIKDHKTACWK